MVLGENWSYASSDYKFLYFNKMSNINQNMWPYSYRPTTCTNRTLTALSVQYVKNYLRFIDIDLQHIHQITQISEHLS